MEPKATTPTVNSLEDLLDEAKRSLRQSEQVAATVPRLRREIKVLERALGAISSPPSSRRKAGPTIKNSIFEALQAAGGTLTFPPGEMLSTIHNLTGGNKNSVGVEIHRLEKAGRIIMERNIDGHPVATTIAPTKLEAVATAWG